MRFRLSFFFKQKHHHYDCTNAPLKLKYREKTIVMQEALSLIVRRQRVELKVATFGGRWLRIWLPALIVCLHQAPHETCMREIETE